MTDRTVDPQQRLDYRQMWRHTLLRLLLTYLAPLLLLALYFHLQYRSLAEESLRRHLVSIAENQASTLDLFLRERVVNLTNLVDDPSLAAAPAVPAAESLLERLRRDSQTFVDLGFFNADGTMVSYAGPYPSLLGRSYSGEPWFRSLLDSERRFVITDMYLGFRQRPHFTIAVRGLAGTGPAAIRATLDPERLAAYLSGLRGSGEVQSLLVNSAGSFQVLAVPAGLAGRGALLVPPREPDLGSAGFPGQHATVSYGYCWLRQTDWALLVLPTDIDAGSVLGDLNTSLLAISAAVILAVFSAIVIRARKVVRHRKEEDAVRRELSGQLHHAARLASVGELAAGVAHEINNPLAVIAEESGLLQDLLDPAFADELTPAEMQVHLASIHEATFRARDITRKLLSFVRKTDVNLAELDLNEIVEDAISGLLEHEMEVSNIRVVRDYAHGLPKVLADRGQLEQVVINLVTNAVDAIEAAGRRAGELKLATSATGGELRLAVSDTGTGIAPEHMERLFMPFHTTKEVGRGTGLGLSVSYGIVKAYGGDIRVETRLGEGSTFTVVLPVEPGRTAACAHAAGSPS